MNSFEWISLIIILLTILGVALGSYPVLRMNRTTIALVGATSLIVIGAISLENAIQAIDFDTIILLFSIMVININFMLSGFFNLITSQILKLAKTPQRLLALVIFVSGLLSALFLNDTIVLVFTPIVLNITIILKRNPIPYLMALATAANVGSAATIIGNPQNILIGTASKIPFTDFALALAPVSIVGMIIIWMVISFIYKKEFKKTTFEKLPDEKIRLLRPLLYKSVAAAIIMLGSFILGFSMPVAALGAASLLLITRRVKPERVFREIDWSLLVFFIGLFIVTKTLDYIGVSNILKGFMTLNTGSEIVDLSIISVILSNLISNVPAVLVLRPMVDTFVNPQMAWLTMAMATTFAGNLTLLGSVANLIVAESAKKGGVKLTFAEYLKAGIPITILTTIFGVLFLIFRGG
jgi:Na+/H+ antiporter NhaD/arsenite permease-like protein